MRIVWKILLIFPLVYVLLLAGLFAVMCRGPEAFTRVMAKTPDAAFMVIPFKPMWLRARAGPLKHGRIAFKSDAGPFGFKAQGVAEVLNGL
jgi:hypothetical protein